MSVGSRKPATSPICWHPSFNAPVPGHLPRCSWPQRCTSKRAAQSIRSNTTRRRRCLYTRSAKRSRAESLNAIGVDRSCVRPRTGLHDLRLRGHARALHARQGEAGMSVSKCDLLIVGAGPAGMGFRSSSRTKARLPAVRTTVRPLRRRWRIRARSVRTMPRADP